MTPNHAIFRKIFSESLKVTNRTFDYLPDVGTKYPFIFIGENSNTDETNLDLLGNTTQTVHIYATRTQRAELDELTTKLINALKSSRMAFEYAISYQYCTQQDAPDNTDVQPLIHRVLDISFSYNKKGDK
ncbi:hypothetical protein [uncultured Streptococcus sp.]|uniref:hypothetical protein n=1 Tax=uncultured Streptococcus sp. TaxID=83427 RepID=UPI0025F96B3C|nr:hypothetical protein [uncultured Streptococcus sp.]